MFCNVYAITTWCRDLACLPHGSRPDDFMKHASNPRWITGSTKYGTRGVEDGYTTCIPYFWALIEGDIGCINGSLGVFLDIGEASNQIGQVTLLNSLSKAVEGSGWIVSCCGIKCRISI